MVVSTIFKINDSKVLQYSTGNYFFKKINEVPISPCYCPHFTDEEHEAQRGEVTCLGSHSK